jgi:hypothetical protein
VRARRLSVTPTESQDKACSGDSSSSSSSITRLRNTRATQGATMWTRIWNRAEASASARCSGKPPQQKANRPCHRMTHA